MYCYKNQIDVPARVDLSDDISAGFQSCVLPSSGNIHELEAIEDCAFLDVIMPNYNYTDRKQNFFSEITPAKNPGDKTTLRFRLPPPKWTVEYVPYEGKVIFR